MTGKTADDPARLADNPSTIASDDAQRELERRALRNVRSLVDKLESGETARRRGSLKILAWLCAGMAIAIAIGYAAYRVAHGPGETRVIPMEPGKRADAPRTTPR